LSVSRQNGVINRSEDGDKGIALRAWPLVSTSLDQLHPISHKAMLSRTVRCKKGGFLSTKPNDAQSDF
jgi:hypothetical protein